MVRSHALLGGLALVLSSGLAHAQARPTSNACHATCAPMSGEAMSYEETRAVSASFDGILSELRSCLDTVGAGSIDPAVILRFDANGALLSKRYDLGGYENLACAKDLVSQPTAASIRHETSLRCESRCRGPATATAAPVPPPVGAAPPVRAAPTVTATVRAETPARPPAPVREQSSRRYRPWYGYQTLIADGAALALMVGGSAAGSGKVAGIGVTTYVFAPPIVHWAHGNIGEGFASMGLRVTAPPLLAVIGIFAGGGFAADRAKDPNDAIRIATGALVGGSIGFLLGYAGVIALDAAVFAHDRKSRLRGRDEDDEAITAPAHIAWRPTIDVQKNGANAGIAGTF